MKKLLCATVLATTIGTSAAFASVAEIPLAPTSVSGFVRASSTGFGDASSFPTSAGTFNVSRGDGFGELHVITTQVAYITAEGVSSPTSGTEFGQAGGDIRYEFVAEDDAHSSSHNPYQIHVLASLGELFRPNKATTTPFALLANTNFSIYDPSGVAVVDFGDPLNSFNCVGSLGASFGCTNQVAADTPIHMDLDDIFTILTNTTYDIVLSATANAVSQQSTDFTDKYLDVFAFADPTIESVTHDPNVILRFSEGLGNSDTTMPASPELSTWAMLALGFAGLGCMAYRRKSQSRLPAVSTRSSGSD